ncbi:MAG: peptidylprolyl isomerase [Deltaproteobacteria bacterium]|nr:peptidylprolyl isomerase [Deltaproteobacteria bacterium]
MMRIENGSKVSLEYTLSVDGGVIDSSEGTEPLRYTHGEQQIIPGLEKELTGLMAGDEKSVTVAARDGYGEFDPQALREIPRSLLPRDLQPEIGMTLAVRGPQGQAMPVQITAVDPDTITVDLNHPLAGKTLHFEVKIVSVD